MVAAFSNRARLLRNLVLTKDALCQLSYVGLFCLTYKDNGQGRIRTSVARKERQIYSLLPLATRPPVQVRRLLHAPYELAKGIEPPTC